MSKPTTWAEHLAGKPGYDAQANYKGAKQNPAAVSQGKKSGQAAIDQGIIDEVNGMKAAALKKALKDLGVEPASGKGSTDKNRELLIANLK